MNTQLNTLKQSKRMESGQALVLIVLAVVGLMGFAALAVDLGRVYAERRRAQSAADAAALAWAYADSQVDLGGTYTLTDVQNRIPAYTSLLENGFQDIPDRVSIELYWPPESGPYGPEGGKTEEERMEYFQVIIHDRVDQIFSQFIFSSSQNLTVEAVARAQPIRSISPGNALVSTSEDACRGLVFNGNISTSVDGGNIFSNTDQTGAHSCYSGIINGSSGGVAVTNGDVLVVGDWEGDNVSPTPQERVPSQDIPDVPTPNCDGFPHYTSTSDITNPLRPGLYDVTVHIASGDLTMEPEGMYCFKQGFTFNGRSLTGEHVMFVMLGGSLSINGGGDINLTRPNDITDSTGKEHYGGMLIFMPYDNDGGIDLSGNSNMNYSGTIFAPGPRHPDSTQKCQVMGNGGSSTIVNLSSSIICNTVNIGGTADVSIIYVEEENYRVRPSVEVSQ